MKNLEVTNTVAEGLDLDRMNATLERLFEGYSSSQMAENDDHEQRMVLTEDFFNFKRLLKSLKD
ncbi:hypothetical protein LV89_00515 [Arcicella aurantiaca]|uniref:Uncharacterized protein n=1 Tax=Arcicella aurantiaca TaxID=591202 RepID=A0A316EFD7_9BACT|nr:hypothetical protein [Arcicella aurantiaca]PWK28962.1 hypothetical protein LV89_00515 [Arcicella aurantiaca]